MMKQQMESGTSGHSPKKVDANQYKNLRINKLLRHNRSFNPKRLLAPLAKLPLPE
jgi:hypothetical protein